MAWSAACLSLLSLVCLLSIGSASAVFQTGTVSANGGSFPFAISNFGDALFGNTIRYAVRGRREVGEAGEEAV